MVESFVGCLQRTPDASLDGRWRLLYASEAAYRSSPFFWAFRKLTDGLSSPVLDQSFAEAVFQITDGIPFKSVGPVWQTITDSGTDFGTLKSEVTLKLSVFDALSGPWQSVMTS